MENNNNMSLGDVMGKAPRTGVTSIDLTQPNPTAKRVEAETADAAKQVTAVQAGPVDTNSIQPFNIHEVLPKREPKQNPLEADMMSQLDAAVDREMESISARIGAVREAQAKEAEEAEDAAAAAQQDKEDAFALGTSDPDSEDYGSDYGDDEDYTLNTSSGSNTHVVVNTDPPIYENYEAPKPTAEAHNVVGDVRLENIEEESAPVTMNTRTETKPNIIDSMNDKDLFDDDDELKPAEEEPDVNEMLENLKVQVKEKITPIKKTFDLSKFTISTKSANAQKIMHIAVHKNMNIADWILFSANRPISMTGLSGPEILKLNPENSGRNRLNTFRDMYRIIYEHVYDANKPEFETWLKQIRFVDLQHIYFALYRATFNGSNFVTYTCPDCNHTFIQDITFESMVKYADEETKEKVRAILAMDSTSPSNDSYKSDLVQISDNYAFAIRTPSVWNVIIETASLSDKFLEKHADLIDVVSYIDKIYFIDPEQQALIPVDTKPDPNDQAKTSARRIKAFYDVISTLSSEEYYRLRSIIAEYDEGASKVSYQIPACTCPKCAKEIPANTDITPDNMLFMRHQLAAIGNMSN